MTDSDATLVEPREASAPSGWGAFVRRVRLVPGRLADKTHDARERLRTIGPEAASALRGALERLRGALPGRFGKAAAEIPTDERPAPQSQAPTPSSPRYVRKLIMPAAIVLVAGVSIGGVLTWWSVAGAIEERDSRATRIQEELAKKAAEVEQLSGRLKQMERGAVRSAPLSSAGDARRAGGDPAASTAAAPHGENIGQRPEAPPDQATGAAPGGDCELKAGSVAEKLKACIEEFNRASR